MPFLSPDVRPSVRLDHLQLRLDGRSGVVSLLGLGGVDFDAAEMLGADEPVLAGAHQPYRRAVGTVEGPPVEMLSEDDIVPEDVFEQHDRPVAVEALEDRMGGRRACRERRPDDQTMQRLERNALPTEIGG
jgi:hypothetical protein